MKDDIFFGTAIRSMIALLREGKDVLEELHLLVV